MPQKKIDSNWGTAATALLPQSLRTAWADEPLPEWVARELGLTPGSTSAALDRSIWSSGTFVLSDRLRNFILNLVNARRSEIRPLNAFVQPLPYWLDLKDLPFSTRTRNCVVRGGLLVEADQLSEVTYGRLFDTWAMGVVSILEFICLVEARLERTITSQQNPDRSVTEELLKIILEPWADQVGPADPRFSDLIPAVPRATVFEILDHLMSEPGEDRGLLEQMAQAVPELQKRVRAIKALPLERQLTDFLRALSRFDGERLAALLDRFGWSGSPPITLEDAGSRLGVTRERVRQLQERISDRLKQISFLAYMPALDLALALLRDKSPISIANASALLKRGRVTEGNFHPGEPNCSCGGLRSEAARAASDNW